jgi:hypothetical protein
MPQHAAQLMACFSAFKQAYLDHLSWEPQPELEARIAALLPGLTLARVDGKSPVEYLGDPQRESVRRMAMHLLQNTPESLDVLAAYWAWELMS